MDKIVAMSSLIGNHTNGSFIPFIDEYLDRFVDFDTQFRFLHKKYFPRIAFKLGYLSKKKTNTFCKSLNILSFTGSIEELRPLI
jgi:hypothetical protein